METLTTREGRTIQGRLKSAADGFQFVSSAGVATPLDGAATIAFDGTTPDPAQPILPFQVVFGINGRLSGRLIGVTDKEVRLAAPSGEVWTIARSGARSITQLAGEAEVLHDGFESLDAKRWSTAGTPALSNERPAAGKSSLRLPAGGSSLTAKLAEPVAAGRVELSFNDDARTEAGQRWFVELAFRGKGGERETIRAILGWSQETVAVESVTGPPLAVQPLVRKPGWHRLVLRFQPDRTDLAIDNLELAHGRGPGGPLIELRIASATLPQSPTPAKELHTLLDDVRIAKHLEPSGETVVEPDQDELQLISGDQLFGAMRSASAERVAHVIDGRETSIPWSRVAGVYLRRTAARADLLEGLWVRAEWQANAERDADQIEGVLKSISDQALTIEVPYLGAVAVPRGQMRQLVILGRMRRLVLDPHPRHLGDEFRADLDPPQPSSTLPVISFTLEKPPVADAQVAIDAVQVEGVGGSTFSDRVKAGELLTTVLLNGKPLGNLNALVKGRNDTATRLRLPAPKSAFQPGKNTITFEQTGLKNRPQTRDNLGLVGVALEFGWE